MAKMDNSISFKNATISLKDNTIVEQLKEDEIVHTLSDVLALFKDKNVNISFKEAKDVVFNDEE
ncbi:YonK family protein [uncultured Metabacillus sp.]|uniref:YonK family protein n=1 Tax=uncultured Metabacillus sp. TaxID=2860135 RepID=UPI00260C0DFC|nr:YonK family protein [uncultured Metabacillus sp.]